MNYSKMSFREFIEKMECTIMDGATATEVQKKGWKLSPPLWTSEVLTNEKGLNILREIHIEYLRAGSNLITANTFRVNIRTFKDDAILKIMAENAVRVVREAIEISNCKDAYIACSTTTIEDCYKPGLKPDTKTLIEEHNINIKNLYETGADVLLAETINNIEEATIISEICYNLKFPFIVSFVCNEQGNLLSGENINEAFEKVLVYDPVAISINCSNYKATKESLKQINKNKINVPIGIYPNVEKRSEVNYGVHYDHYFETDSTEKDFCNFLDLMVNEYKIKILGGCCGTSPSFIKELNQYVRYEK